MHALADNIVIHQTNQQLNNRYDTNFFAAKVKEIESPEETLEQFNSVNNMDSIRINVKNQEDGTPPNVFQFIKVASVNPDIMST